MIHEEEDKMVFTPMNIDGKRLKFPDSAIHILLGALHQRRLGIQAIISIKGKTYVIMGLPCGLPNCNCDALILNHLPTSKELKVYTKRRK